MASVKQSSEQEMKVWDNYSWSSLTFEKQRHAGSAAMTEGTDRSTMTTTFEQPGTDEVA